MAISSLEVPRVGMCTFERTQVSLDPDSSKLFKLFRAGEYVGHFTLAPACDEQGKMMPIQEVINLEVESRFRGRKMASFLIGQAVEFCRANGSSGLVTYAANERTISSFSGNFPDSNISFHTTDEWAVIKDSNISKAEAIEFLAAQRRRQPSGDDKSKQLKGGPTVLITGILD